MDSSHTYTGQPVDIVLDTSSIVDLSAPREGGRSWNDLFAVASTLPNVRLVIPSIVADLELKGTIPRYQKDRVIQENFNRDNRRLGHVKTPVFLDGATRIVSDGHGHIKQQIAGNPHIIIWDSDSQHYLYDQIKQMKADLFAQGLPPEKVYKAIHNKIHNEGDNAILEYARSADCTHRAIIISGDTGLKDKALGGDDTYPWVYNTTSRHAIGCATTVGFVQAMEKAYGKALGDMLARTCNEGQAAYDTAHIVACVNKHRAKHSKTKDMLDPHTRHAIFPGNNRAGELGVRLDDVLVAGRQMQLAQPAVSTPGDDTWLGSARESKEPSSGAVGKG